MAMACGVHGELQMLSLGLWPELGGCGLASCGTHCSTVGSELPWWRARAVEVVAVWPVRARAGQVNLVASFLVESARCLAVCGGVLLAVLAVCRRPPCGERGMLV